MVDSSLFLRFFVSLAIGILVGLQREFAINKKDFEIAAGIRTFGIVGLTGCSAALLCELTHSPLPLIGFTLVLGAFFAINYYIDSIKGEQGLTTKISLILTFICGCLCYWKSTLTLAISISVATTVVLSVKVQLHQFVQKLTAEDIHASLKFAVISAIVLPILPNQIYGPEPFAIFNPLKLWYFVVLISGISFVGYVFIKIAGSKNGIGLTGILGGLASSTAVTVSFTGKSKDTPELSRSFAFAILLAWTIMFARVLLLVAFLNNALISKLLFPMIGSIVAGLLVCVFLYRAQKTDNQDHDVTMRNPFELGLAIKFGVLFAVILFISRAAQVYLGDLGVYLSSFFAGMADVDAIAFSMAKLSRDVNALDPTIATRAIVIAAVSNTIVKGCIVLLGASKPLKRALLPGFLLMATVGIVLAFSV